MKKISLAIVCTLMILCVFAQKTISEATIVYKIDIESLQKQSTSNSLTGSTFTVYLKGIFSRTDMISSLGSEKTIYDGKTGSAVILKEYSGQKLMITMKKEDWAVRIKKSSEINFEFSNDSKSINGYKCKKATAKLENGSVVTVFYATDLQTVNKDYSTTFNNLPGLPLEYEFLTSKLKFTYTLDKFDLNTVPANKFEFPKSGYRVMTYEENKSEK